jgi:hypothetical protein
LPREKPGWRPIFFSNDAAWILADRNGDYIPIPGGPSPTRNDSAHPHVGNGTAAQPAYRVADLANPNIKPWAKEIMTRENDKVLAGGPSGVARPVHATVAVAETKKQRRSTRWECV